MTRLIVILILAIVSIVNGFRSINSNRFSRQVYFIIVNNNIINIVDVEYNTYNYHIIRYYLWQILNHQVFPILKQVKQLY